jgi:hypothetical protein
MDLVRDVLDSRVVDRNGREMGRVDRLLLDIRGDRPPRVVALELGPAVLAHRVHPLLGRFVAGMEHAFGIDEGRPLHVAFEDVDIGDSVKVDVAFGDTSAATIEKRVRRWLSFLPQLR